MNDQRQQGFEERARIGYEEALIATATLTQVAIELGMSKERFFEIRNQVEVEFNKYRLQNRQKRGDL